MTLPDKAISVHAPWAWATMQPAPYGKDVENRSHGKRKFPTNVLGRVWVHASLYPGRGPIPVNSRREEQFDEVVDALYATHERALFRVRQDWTRDEIWRRRPTFERLDALRGHIVGSVEVHGYATPDCPPDSPWYIPGNLAVLVRNPVPLARPVPALGALGWWTVPPTVLEQLEEQERAA
jgi:hypothetical protein